MPSDDDNRIHVTFSKHLDVLELIRRDAALEDRSESAIVVRAMVKYYRQREEDAELFTPNRLHEAKQGHVPVFETRHTSLERPSTTDRFHGQDES